MPKDPRIKKVLVIGSGPIIIGQAAEFDYSGTQACRALKSEGVETILVNSNPATIMTDPDIADHVYIEPLTAEVIERIIEKEKPDAILPNLGGQMGLNLSMELARSGFLDRSGVHPEELAAVIGRGGLVFGLKTGGYLVNEDLCHALVDDDLSQPHASNLGGLLAREIAAPLGIPAYIYDGVTVDELLPINKLTGLPSMRRKGMGHNLNTRAAAMRYAREQGKPYKDITAIVAHLGGGITVNLHHNGRIEDCVNDEGPFSPERAGGLPMYDVIHRSFEEGQSDKSMMKLVKSRGGLLAHLSTTDCREVEHRIQNGDVHAKLIYDAMALNVAKFIGKTAPGVCGKVDAILLTGGIAYSQYVTSEIEKRVSFLAPVVLYPGEDEMRSLALGGLRLLRGEEPVHTFAPACDLSVIP